MIRERERVLNLLDYLGKIEIFNLTFGLLTCLIDEN